MRTTGFVSNIYTCIVQKYTYTEFNITNTNTTNVNCEYFGELVTKMTWYLWLWFVKLFWSFVLHVTCVTIYCECFLLIYLKYFHFLHSCVFYNKYKAWHFIHFHTKINFLLDISAISLIVDVLWSCPAGFLNLLCQADCKKDRKTWSCF